MPINEQRQAEIAELEQGWDAANQEDALPVKVVNPPAVQTPAEVPAPVVAPETPASEIAPVAATEPAATEPAPAPAAEDWEQKFKALEHSTKSWDGRLKASAQREKDLQAQLEAQRAAQAPPVTTPAASSDSFNLDDPELKQVAEDYPDVMRPLLKTFKQFDERLTQAARPDNIKPLSDKLEQMEIQQHFARISAVHPDWRDIAAGTAVQDWAATKPAYQRSAIERVLQAGTSQEINDLLTDYKQAITPDPTPVTDTAAAVAAEAKRKQQLAAAGAVKTRSGGPPAGRADPNDFEGAWNDPKNI